LGLDYVKLSPDTFWYVFGNGWISEEVNNDLPAIGLPAYHQVKLPQQPTTYTDPKSYKLKTLPTTYVFHRMRWSGTDSAQPNSKMASA
jgi:hypothetical protein